MSVPRRSRAGLIGVVNSATAGGCEGNHHGRQTGEERSLVHVSVSFRRSLERRRRSGPPGTGRAPLGPGSTPDDLKQGGAGSWHRPDQHGRDASGFGEPASDQPAWRAPAAPRKDEQRTTDRQRADIHDRQAHRRHVVDLIVADATVLEAEQDRQGAQQAHKGDPMTIASQKGTLSDHDSIESNSATTHGTRSKPAEWARLVSEPATSPCEAAAPQARVGVNRTSKGLRMCGDVCGYGHRKAGGAQ
jgi:hypothetical protein